MIDKIQLEELKPSSRISPFIRFNQKKQLYRQVLEIKNFQKSYDSLTLIKDFNLSVSAGERVAIIGENGVGKTTLLNCLTKHIEYEEGSIKFSENAGQFAIF